MKPLCGLVKTPASNYSHGTVKLSLLLNDSFLIMYFTFANPNDFTRAVHGVVPVKVCSTLGVLAFVLVLSLIG